MTLVVAPTIIMVAATLVMLVVIDNGGASGNYGDDCSGGYGSDSKTSSYIFFLKQARQSEKDKPLHRIKINANIE